MLGLWVQEVGEQRAGLSVHAARTGHPVGETRPLTACSCLEEGPQQPSAASCLETRLPSSPVSRNSSESSRHGGRALILAACPSSWFLPVSLCGLQPQRSDSHTGPTRTHSSRSLTLVLTHSLVLTHFPSCPSGHRPQLPLQGLGQGLCLHADLSSNSRPLSTTRPARPLWRGVSLSLGSI